VASTPQQTFDLFCIGLYWVQNRSKGTINGWVGNGILRTVCAAGGLTRADYAAAAGNPSEPLRRYFVARSEPVWPDEPRAAKTRMKKSGKLLIIYVSEPVFFSDRILGPEGYNIVLTELGMAHVQRVMSSYELSQEEFLKQWGNRKLLMNLLHQPPKKT
jgi:hypothetical protein